MPSSLPFLAAGGTSAGMTAGGAAAGGGFLSSLFSSANMFPAMMGAGMGMGTAQAFGGSGSGYAPQFLVPMSAEGKKLKTSLYEKTKQQYTQGLMPQSLTSIYMGKIKRQEGATRRTARGFLTSMAGGRTRGGTQIKAALTEGERMMRGATGPAEWKGRQREEEIRNALAMMQNIRNIEMQTPLLRAKASMYKDLMGQGKRAAQGQALGNLAQWAAMMKVYG